MKLYPNVKQLFSKRDRKRPEGPLVHVIYQKNVDTHDDIAVLVVPTREEARRLSTEHGTLNQTVLEWENIEVLDAQGKTIRSGDTLYLVSEGGPSDDAAAEFSPNALAAFVDISDPSNLQYLSDPRLRTVVVGQLLI